MPRMSVIGRRLTFIIFGRGRSADGSVASRRKKQAARAAAACLLALALSGALRSQDAVAPTHQGLQMMEQGRYREAEQHLRRALELAGPADSTAVYNLASLYQRQGRLREAESLHKIALEQLEQTHGPFAPEVAQSLNDLGALYGSLRRYSRAIEVLERAVGILDAHPPLSFACSVFNNLGNTYLDIGQFGKARDLARRALTLVESGNCDDRSTLGYILSSLGAGYFQQKQYIEAEAALRKAISTFADTLGPHHPDYGRALTNLAAVYHRQGRFREALPFLESAIEVLERSSGTESPALASTLYAYAEVIKALGRTSEARQVVQRARSVAIPDTGTVDVKTLSDHR